MSKEKNHLPPPCNPQNRPISRKNGSNRGVRTRTLTDRVRICSATITPRPCGVFADLLSNIEDFRQTGNRLFQAFFLLLDGQLYAGRFLTIAHEKLVSNEGQRIPRHSFDDLEFAQNLRLVWTGSH
jgi:hypothetical protein